MGSLGWERAFAIIVGSVLIALGIGGSLGTPIVGGPEDTSIIITGFGHDLVHLITDTSIAFVSATKKIKDANNGLALFKTGETIVVSGSASNDRVYTVATGGVAGEIVVN